MAIRARMTEKELLIHKEVAERVMGEDSHEVEILQEPGRLLISPVGGASESRIGRKIGETLLSLGEDPVEGPEATDASVNLERYFYTGG